MPSKIQSQDLLYVQIDTKRLHNIICWQLTGCLAEQISKFDRVSVCAKLFMAFHDGWRVYALFRRFSIQLVFALLANLAANDGLLAKGKKEQGRQSSELLAKNGIE